MFNQNNIFNRNNIKPKIVRSLGKSFAVLSIIWLIFNDPNTSRFAYISIFILLFLGAIYCLVIYPIVDNVRNGDVKSFKDLDIISIIPLIVFIIIASVFIIGFTIKLIK